MKNTVDVACYYCFAVNRVKIGTEFYDADSWYTCHSCNKSSHITLRQKPLQLPDYDGVQKGTQIE